MHQKGVGTLARLIHAIPVIRPQDMAGNGEGRIHLLNAKTNPTLISGIDTQFLKQVRPQDTLILPRSSGKLQVVRVISDTEVEVKKWDPSDARFNRMLSLLTKPEGTAYKCIPHVEQDGVYDKVYDELNNGECITIFPEGGSHDRAEMLPLKAGVTIMALGAMAKYPDLDVKIVPCGLNYFHAHRFRSRAVIEFGNPITVSSDLIEKFKQGGPDKRDACSALLETISYALKSVTINAPNDQTLMMIQAARRLYKPAANRKLHIAQVVDMNRRFVIGYNLYKDNPKVIELQQKVTAYNQLLKYHGLQDHQVPNINLREWRTFFLLVHRVLVLLVWGLLSFPGTRKAREALKGSSVKILGRDVLATWKLLVAMVLIPTLYGLYTLIVLGFSLQTDWDWKWKLLLPLATWIMLPFISYASMRFGENGMDVYKSLRPLYMALVDQDSTMNLRTIRENLSEDITNLINEYGPNVFSDFDPASGVYKNTDPSKQRVSELGEGGKTFSQIASEFVNTRAMDWLDDKNIFNWGRQDDSDSDDETLYFLDKHGTISASTSEAESHYRTSSSLAFTKKRTERRRRRKHTD
ncbi:hypothetical protein DM01DRAFT_1294295 [Hesseltinella vesiculosa]|uniref:Phospholipid/glycerol acyltransferase domain-containing protein n=1 Tax=Hesseltinella vesiculosa TaxID=101127 RepID=A0A1X2G600_9FUNG|nr:hypothetical protein DM01DRAFT_1294295 [Hesseltinella vesiculosa]